jgi:hypothetical protein
MEYLQFPPELEEGVFRRVIQARTQCRQADDGKSMDDGVWSMDKSSIAYRPSFIPIVHTPSTFA